MRVSLVAYDRVFLQRSAEWLRDPEIKQLTRTPDFTSEGQERFFNSIGERQDYLIWGIWLNGEGPIGAVGIKSIASGSGEYWAYIGERRWWNQGLAGEIFSQAQEHARARGIKELIGLIGQDNPRALKAYERLGFERVGENEGVITIWKAVSGNED